MNLKRIFVLLALPSLPCFSSAQVVEVKEFIPASPEAIKAVAKAAETGTRKHDPYLKIDKLRAKDRHIDLTIRYGFTPEGYKAVAWKEAPLDSKVKILIVRFTSGPKSVELAPGGATYRYGEHIGLYRASAIEEAVYQGTLQNEPIDCEHDGTRTYYDSMRTPYKLSWKHQNGKIRWEAKSGINYQLTGFAETTPDRKSGFIRWGVYGNHFVREDQFKVVATAPVAFPSNAIPLGTKSTTKVRMALARNWTLGLVSFRRIQERLSLALQV